MTDRTDDFNRTNGGLGANWTAQTDAQVTGTLAIISNAVEPPVSTDAHSYWSADTFASDHYAQVKYVSQSDAGSNGGPTVRAQSATNRHYEADYSSGFSASAMLYYDGTNWNFLGGLPTVSGGETIKFEVTGTTLTPSVNGTPSTGATDASLSGGGPGIHCFSQSGNFTVDDWLGGPITAASNPVLPIIWPVFDVPTYPIWLRTWLSGPPVGVGQQLMGQMVM